MTEGHSEGKGANEEVVDVLSSFEESSPSEGMSLGKTVLLSVVVGSAELASKVEVGTQA
jgi:hypothetical protein